jgi:hypothetical protein
MEEVMETTLNVRDPEIVGGHEIDVTVNNTRNPRLHRFAEQLSRLNLFMLESDSNNMSSKVKPSDVRTIRALYDYAKETFLFQVAEENNDMPTGSYEFAYQILQTHQQEIQRVTNPKIREMLAETWDLMNVCLSVDSANSQGYVAAEDIETIETRIEFVDRVFDRLIGKGEDLSDTGVFIPALEMIGRVRPSLTNDFAKKCEPSKRLPLSRHRDVPDTPSEAKGKK